MVVSVSKFMDHLKFHFDDILETIKASMQKNKTSDFEQFCQWKSVVLLQFSRHCLFFSHKLTTVSMRVSYESHITYEIFKTLEHLFRIPFLQGRTIFNHPTEFIMLKFEYV